ncbi:proline dehydrogenase 1, mitochondrial-like isoform X2 [Mytilus californianus]|uniref:proline dehydrogenase 1, mitochondrial-like isoform X2 n=1 Tax=Mytilus californianus TaxID=6549 RepID=UPI0022463A51|nr:proline dehydrogenase 1, mitochondrial-like isoform X2 [Mytilus californianus]
MANVFKLIRKRNLLLISHSRKHPLYSLQTFYKSTLGAEIKDAESLSKLTQDEEKQNKLDLTFGNAEEAFRSKKTSELVRALFVFNLCSVEFLVKNNIEILKWSRRLLGKTLFTTLMKGTFYGHFVAGEDQIAIRPLVSRNQQFGVKSILDYSVEEDLSSKQAKEAEAKGCVPENQPPLEELDPEQKRFAAHEEFLDRREKVVSARTYFYDDEAKCDDNMNIFLQCVDAVSGSTKSTGFVAIKLTALGRPQFLLQLSDLLVTTRNLFEKFAGEGDILLKKFRQEDFQKTLDVMGVPISRDQTKRWFSILDISQDGEVDLWDWDNLLEKNLQLCKLLIVPNKETGIPEQMMEGLTDEEDEQLKNMLKRLNTIVKYAKEKDVRVMVDAEQTYFQPAISRIVIEMMRKFNKEKAIVFNTYQTYLKSALTNLKVDLDLSRREKFQFGAKLVRGAYMEQERERAASVGYEDPINPNYHATSDMYHACLEEVFYQIKQRPLGQIAVMVASHNEDTVRFAVEGMDRYDIKPSDRLICFGQLLGMCDQVSFPLGQAGYSVYKYVPYGPVEEVLPYLSRRAMENKGILKKVQKEKSLLWKELKRRVKAGQLRYNPLENNSPVG